MKLRVAMPAWEIGRASSGLGVKVGGLAVVVEELAPELEKAAAGMGVDLEVVTLTPCFAHYDKSRLKLLDVRIPVTIGDHTFDFQVYEHVFPDGQKVVYFWDEWQLHWTTDKAIYPTDPQLSLTLFAAVGQAMAGYIKQAGFDTVHLHDYHVGLVPFYLGDDYLQSVPVHLTIHNATYQGIIPLVDGGYQALDRINLPGAALYHRYFDFFNNINLMKGCMLKVHETGGKVTTVSGDIAGTWGYAAELRESHHDVWAKALAQKGSPPGEVFVPNRHLDLFEKLPIAGITNGMRARNRADNRPELKADVLRRLQEKLPPGATLFSNPVTQAEMLAEDHNFDVESLEVKTTLKRLLHLEAFGTEMMWDPVLFTVVGRLVDQKHLGLVADVIDRTLAYDSGAKFILLASAPDGDGDGEVLAQRFRSYANRYPNRVYFNSTFDEPLSKLILAGGDFTLIPSRFEPCGLVDYEASLLGTIVIGRATGGLPKVRHCAYLYEWQDMSDGVGEAHAFFAKIREAIDVYRHQRDRHGAMMRDAMTLNAQWNDSARQYVNMYRYGLLVKDWHRERRALVEQFIDTLGEERDLFATFFIPGRDEYGDAFDWQLKHALDRRGTQL